MFSPVSFTGIVFISLSLMPEYETLNFLMICYHSWKLHCIAVKKSVHAYIRTYFLTSRCQYMQCIHKKCEHIHTCIHVYMHTFPGNNSEDWPYRDIVPEMNAPIW